jgi:uncharacterized protein (DUF1501 family)
MGAGAPLFLGGYPVKLMSGPLDKLLKDTSEDRVLVLIQLAGGNDGLNTLIPLSQYDKYLEYRTNIAIPENGTRKYIELDQNLPDPQQLGLHPDMTSVKNLYDDGKALFIQNVGYDNMNLSHFRGRDIWFMGGNSEDYYPSGWIGRYLDNVYPGYPEAYPNSDMPDPLGLEFGYTMSLAFFRNEGIPAGIAINDPETFYQLVSGVGIEPPAYLPDSYAGDEMKYLIDIELKSNQYAERIKEVYDSGINSSAVEYPVTYPLPAPVSFQENELAPQLKIIARLMSGGLKTKLFLVRINGFDTHSEQVMHDDTTMGAHAALLYHVSEAVKAFLQDMKEQGMEERVILVTTSEFGRRVFSNASFGTDHGKAAPVLLFGPGIKPGVIGQSPDLDNMDDGNLVHEFDYRQIYTSLLIDWLGASPEAVEAAYFQDFTDTRLDIIKSPFGIGDYPVQSSRTLHLKVYPNPANATVFLELESPVAGNTVIDIFDLNGKQVFKSSSIYVTPGKSTFPLNIEGIPAGTYLVRVSAGNTVGRGKLVISH